MADKKIEIDHNGEVRGGGLARLIYDAVLREVSGDADEAIIAQRGAFHLAADDAMREEWSDRVDAIAREVRPVIVAQQRKLAMRLANSVGPAVESYVEEMIQRAR